MYKWWHLYQLCDKQCRFKTRGQED